MLELYGRSLLRLRDEEIGRNEKNGVTSDTFQEPLRVQSTIVSLLSVYVVIILTRVV